MHVSAEFAHALRNIGYMVEVYARYDDGIYFHGDAGLFQGANGFCLTVYQ
jgi:hypothetical protein